MYSLERPMWTSLELSMKLEMRFEEIGNDI